MGKLWESLDLVRERGMLKGNRGYRGGPHCALGFMDEAYGVMVEQCPAARDAAVVVAGVAAEMFPGRDDVKKDTYNGWTPGLEDSAVCRVAAFNNHPETTKADLELVFEKAAIKSDEILG